MKNKQIDFSLSTAKTLWNQLGDIPCNENGELDEEFNPEGFNASFEVGTDAEDVWHWFEETFNLSIVQDLMFTD